MAKLNSDANGDPAAVGTASAMNEYLLLFSREQIAFDLANKRRQEAAALPRMPAGLSQADKDEFK
jgi:hypothetical protein